MTYIWFKYKWSVLKRGILFSFLFILCVLYIICYSHKNFISYTITPLINNICITNVTISHHHLLINESNKNITSLYYRRVTSERNSSYPFISGDTFRALADYVYDETRQDNLQAVKYGDIVFVKADMFQMFFDRAYRSINNSFVLVSHNSDFSAPVQYKNKLEENKILAWYASNPSIRNHSKLFPIPIGLANVRWPAGNLKKLMNAFHNHRKPWSNRTTLLYVNFDSGTNQKERTAALSQATKISNVTIMRKKISFETYLEQIGNAKFVLSPPGNGLDCHRTWEALMMGAAPIVLSSGLDPLFNKIPAVIIKDWSSLTEKFISTYTFSSYDNLMPVVLYARYWRERLLKHRD